MIRIPSFTNGLSFFDEFPIFLARARIILWDLPPPNSPLVVAISSNLVNCNIHLASLNPPFSLWYSILDRVLDFLSVVDLCIPFVLIQRTFFRPIQIHTHIFPSMPCSSINGCRHNICTPSLPCIILGLYCLKL